MSVGQKSRKNRTSKGQRVSSRPVPLSAVEKVNLGHGLLDSYSEIEMKTAWRGVGEIRGPVFNQAQADENRRTMPHLFSERVR